MARMKDSECPFWGTEATLEETRGDRSLIDSPRAGGKFWISGTAMAMTLGSSRVAASTYILSENLRGSVPYIATHLLERLKDSRPLTTTERFNQLLKAMRVELPDLGNTMPFRPFDMDFRRLRAAIECPTVEGDKGDGCLQSLHAYWRHAFDLGLLSEDGDKLSFTVPGLMYLEELGAQLSDADQIFVAMWFHGDRMRQLYEEAIKPAIEAAGYVAMRIDNAEHNEKIDDQIIAEIRKSKAVVVDLTCGVATPLGEWSRAAKVGAPRGGVYYEAGFAKGIGLPVVWLVDQGVADVENVVHFDTRQYNQIRWQNDWADVRTRLHNRLVATLGQGPMPVDKPSRA